MYNAYFLSIKYHGVSLKEHVPNKIKILSRRFGQQGKILPLMDILHPMT